MFLHRQTLCFFWGLDFAWFWGAKKSIPRVRSGMQFHQNEEERTTDVRTYFLSRSERRKKIDGVGYSTHTSARYVRTVVSRSGYPSIRRTWEPTQHYMIGRSTRRPAFKKYRITRRPLTT